MKHLAVGWFLMVSLIQNYSSGNPIQWVRMKDAYRQIPSFLAAYDEELGKKVMKLTPGDLVLIGKPRNEKLLQLFNYRERELLIPCGLLDWLRKVGPDLQLMGTGRERLTIKRLRKILVKKLKPNPDKKCQAAAASH